MHPELESGLPVVEGVTGYRWIVCDLNGDNATVYDRENDDELQQHDVESLGPDLAHPAGQRWAATLIVQSLDRWPDIEREADRWLCRCLLGDGTTDDQLKLRHALTELE